jgi:hypothetical protein
MLFPKHMTEATLLNRCLDYARMTTYGQFFAQFDQLWASRVVPVAPSGEASRHG